MNAELVMNMNISLTEELANFIKSKVAGGRYSSSSEVVREALRLMEKVEREDTEKLALLRAAWKEGIDSGDAGELDFALLKQQAHARLDKRKN
jgi:antitoxin ParD1/3/4